MPSFITPKNSIKKQNYKKYLHNSFIQTPLKKDIQTIKVRLNFKDKFYLSLNLPFLMTIKQLNLIVNNLLTLHHKYWSSEEFARIELDETQPSTFYLQQISKNVFDYLLRQQEINLGYFHCSNNQEKTSKLNIKLVYKKNKSNFIKNNDLSSYKFANRDNFCLSQAANNVQNNCLVLNRLIKFSDILQIQTYKKKIFLLCPYKLINSFSKIEYLFQIRNLLVKCSSDFQSQIFSNQITQIFNNQSGFCFIFDKIPIFYVKSTMKVLFDKYQVSQLQNIQLKIEVLKFALDFCQIMCFIEKNIINNLLLNKIISFKRTHFDKLFKCNLNRRICLSLSDISELFLSSTNLSELFLSSTNSDPKNQDNNLSCLQQWYNQFIQLLINNIKSPQIRKQLNQLIQKVKKQSQNVDLALANKNFKKQMFSSILLRFQAQILNLKTKIFQVNKNLLFFQSQKSTLSLSEIYLLQKLDKSQNKKKNQLRTKQQNVSEESNEFLFYYLLKKEQNISEKKFFLSNIFKFQRTSIKQIPLQKDKSINIHNKSTQKKPKKSKWKCKNKKI